MARVPILTTPQQGLIQAPTTQVPMQGVTQAPVISGQSGQIGQALKQAGQVELQETKAEKILADKIQAEKDDAKGKELDNKYATYLNQKQLEFATLHGKDASDSAIKFSDEIEAARKEFEAEAENDTQKMMFTASSAVRMRSANMAIQTRALQELEKYNINETKNRIDSNVRSASMYWESWNKKGGDFSIYQNAAIKEVNDLADKMGLKKDSEQRKNMVVATNSQITTQVVQNMANDDKFIEATDFLEKTFKSGNLDEKTYQTLENQLVAGYENQLGQEEADRIYLKNRDNTSGSEGEPSLSVMMEDVNKIENDAVRKIAKAAVKQRYAENVAIKKEEYNNLFINLQIQAFDAGYMGWKTLSNSEFMKLKPQDRAKIMQGPAKTDDIDVVMSITRSPEKYLKPGVIETVRHSLTDSTYLKYYSMAYAPDNEMKITNIQVDNDMIADALIKAGLTKYINPTSKNEKLAAQNLENQIKRALEDEMRARDGKPLDLKVRRDIISGIVNSKVLVDQWGSDPTVPAFTLVTPEQRKSGYVKIGDDLVYLKDVNITDSDRQAIINKIKRETNRHPTEQQIIELWYMIKKRLGEK